MLSGWYCRSMASQQTAQTEETDPNVDEDSATDDSQEQQQTQSGVGIGVDSGNGEANSFGTTGAVDYKTQYRYLKRKLKFLIYENEFSQDALRSNQRRLLKVSRDRAFLLDRLLQYEKPENTSSESDETDSSEDDATKEAKRRKLEQNAPSNGVTGVGSTRGRKKKTQHVQPSDNLPPQKPQTQEVQQSQHNQRCDLQQTQQMQMSAEEVERHLQSRQNVMDLVQDRAPATVPTEMFSNEPSLDSESNDHIIDGSSPTHVAAEECVQMEYTN